jgi:hypothetical protein
MTTRQLILAISLIFAWVVSVHHDWYKTIIPVVTQIRYPIVLAAGRTTRCQLNQCDSGITGPISFKRYPSPASFKIKSLRF